MGKYSSFRDDITKFHQLASDGQISPNVVVPLACIADALRNAQFINGPGYLPVGVLLDPVPVLHIQNYLKDRKARKKCH